MNKTADIDRLIRATERLLQAHLEATAISGEWTSVDHIEIRAEAIAALEIVRGKKVVYELKKGVY